MESKMQDTRCPKCGAAVRAHAYYTATDGVRYRVECTGCDYSTTGWRRKASKAWADHVAHVREERARAAVVELRPECGPDEDVRCATCCHWRTSTGWHGPNYCDIHPHVFGTAVYKHMKANDVCCNWTKHQEMDDARRALAARTKEPGESGGEQGSREKYEKDQEEVGWWLPVPE